MAESIHYEGGFTPDVKAKNDLRTHQFKAVQFGAAGVDLAGTDANSGPVFVLWNKPNSGEACTLIPPGNITKALAGIAVLRGNQITVNASAYFVVGSALSVPLAGVAITAVASGSVFSLLTK